MTTEQHSAPRRLYRRSDERVIAGVASGLGDYFNVDPLLIRIGLVASLVFGGLGIFLYAAAWLLVPDEASGRSVAARIFGGASLGGGLAGSVVVVLGVIIVLGIVGGIFGVVLHDDGAFLLAVLVIAAGVFLLRRTGPADGPVAAAVAPESASAPEGESRTGEATATQPVPTVVRREPRPPSPLGWYILGAILVGMGGLALASGAWGLGVTPGTYAGLAMAIIGAGLLVATWWGNARFLIVIGLLLLPVAWAASLVSVPLEGGFGSQRFMPASADEIREEYHLGGGSLLLDLTSVEGEGEPIAVNASVALGELIVLVPDDAMVEIDASVGGGAMRILGTPHRGTHLEDRQVIGEGEPDFILELEAGIGEIQVDTRTPEGR